MERRTRLLEWFVALILATPSAYACGCNERVVSGSESTGLKALNYLINSPDEHAGEMIELEACLAVSHHGMMLTDCAGGGAFVNFDPLNEGAFDDVKRMIESGARIKRREIESSRMILSGVFRSEAGDYPIYRLLVSELSCLVESVGRRDGL